jgi:RNA polymerase sigma-32 factor
LSFPEQVEGVEPRPPPGAVIALAPAGAGRKASDGVHPKQTMTNDLTTFRAQTDVDAYVAEAARFPLLDPEEERRLAERYRKERDPQAARQLLGSHLRLVIKIARGFGGYGLPLGDLIAEGSVGLMQALAKFEPERGFRFSTYAMWWVRAAMQEYILHNRSLVKMGTTAAQKKLFFNLGRLKRELGEVGTGDLSPKSVASIAEALEVSEVEVVEMDRRLAGRDHSLTTPLRADGEAEWQDMLVDEGQDQERLVADADELAWRRDLLRESLKVLNEREQHILVERRLKDEPKTLEELCQVYGVSRERVRQIEVRAFEKLQKAMIAASANGRAPIPHLAA